MSNQTIYALSDIQHPEFPELRQLIKRGILINAWMRDVSCVRSDDVDIHGGRFYGGVFNGGVFHDGWFNGGVFNGGVFNGGVFSDGVFHDGVFNGGVFNGGVFNGGVFNGGVFSDGVFSISPPTWKGSRHTCYMCGVYGSHLKIGCECHSVEHWLSNYKEIGENNGYSAGQIAEYARYIQEAYDMYKKEIKQ